VKKAVLLVCLTMFCFGQFAEQFEKECNNGNYVGCGFLGNLYYYGDRIKGNEVKQDYKKAFDYYIKACDGKYAGACNNLGVMYHEGEGIGQDYKKAFDYYTKACDDNDGEACYNLGTLYFNGQGVKQDYSQAKEYFGKACDLGDQEGCNFK